MKRIDVLGVALLALTSIIVQSGCASTRRARRNSARCRSSKSTPPGRSFQASGVFGQVSSVSIDDSGHAWILQRPSTVRADQKDKPRRPFWSSMKR